MSIEIPKGTKCELCGMLAEYAEKGSEGAVHYYCGHHKPIYGRHSERSKESHTLPYARGEISRRAAPRNDELVNKHAGHTVNMFKTRFWVCLVLTLPILAYAEIVQNVFGLDLPDFRGRVYLVLALASVIFFYGGWIFIKGALTELKHRLPGMMTLIALAITTAYIYSIVATFTPVGEPLFWEIGSLITVMLLGHWIEMAAVGHASGALKELAKLLPDTGERLATSGQVEIVPVTELQVGDVVLVRPGAKVPADGEIVEGVSSLNESMITGESRPVNKKVGEEVIAGTVNGEGVLTVHVTKVGKDTALAGIMRLVAQAQASRSRVQALADRAAYFLTLIAVGGGVITAAVWLVLDTGVANALTRTVAVLVIACPHALGLAVPLVASISTTLSARNGLLVREKLALEAARKIEVVLFDKTGTLTKGEYGVTDIISNSQFLISNETTLSLAAGVEQGSEHPVAKAIVKAAQERGLAMPQTNEVKALPGRGVEGIVEGKRVMVGGDNLVRELHLNTTILSSMKVLQAQGKTIVYLVVDGQLWAAFGVADVIRDESREAVRALHNMGVRVAMVTGDAKPVAEWVAGELGIDECYAEVLPENKVAIVQRLQRSNSEYLIPNKIRNWKLRIRTLGSVRDRLEIGNSRRRRVVAMVGDGINDAPALVAADVGIAIGAGTDVAIESAGIILVRNDPRDIVRVIQLARATYRKMVENLIWATGYNAFAIPAAAGALAPWGIVLAPALAALFMSVSTVIVAFNAQLLRRLRL